MSGDKYDNYAVRRARELRLAQMAEAQRQALERNARQAARQQGSGQ